MGWQDRDYARATPAYGPVRRSFGPGGGLLRGRSIVNVLLAINVGVYVLAAFSPTMRGFLYGWGMMRADAVVQGQVWRLITAQYLHAGIWHLAFNMIALHFLGRPLEQLWSPGKFFTIYTLCGLFGNVFYTFLGARGVIPPDWGAVGASGSIYGLLGIVAVMFPTATVYVYFMFPIRIRTAAIIFGAIAFLSVLERGQNYGGEACHLAGLAFGVWWAWKGDRWWSSTGWGLPRFRRVARPVRRGSWADSVEQRRADAETVDRILKKVYDQGIHSLTEAEKRALKEATERQRMRESQAGRVDSL